MDPTDSSLFDRLRDLRDAPHATGFIHLERAFSVGSIDTMRLYAFTRDYGGDVFQTVVFGEKVQDQTRKQYLFSDADPIRNQYSHIYLILSTLFKSLGGRSYSVSQESVLASVPGGHDQDLHGDFDLRNPQCKNNFLCLQLSRTMSIFTRPITNI